LILELKPGFFVFRFFEELAWNWIPGQFFGNPAPQLTYFVYLNWKRRFFIKVKNLPTLELT
jgi:hypothetical protein